MLGRFAKTCASAGFLSLPSLAYANAMEYAISIPVGSLANGLQDLQRQTHIELLYDRNVIRDLDAPRVDGRLTTEAALRQLLSDTSLNLRRASSGAWIIENQTTAPLARPDAQVAEILVIGRKTQNADIRRFQN